ncbi:hypothetical protein BD414DRAFT_481288 [Trametes punicea]|nr:hypothetical protein BD414DRAFT_481288 [Trametes punicea]
MCYGMVTSSPALGYNRCSRKIQSSGTHGQRCSQNISGPGIASVPQKLMTIFQLVFYIYHYSSMSGVDAACGPPASAGATERRNTAFSVHLAYIRWIYLRKPDRSWHWHVRLPGLRSCAAVSWYTSTPTLNHILGEMSLLA